MTKGSGRVSRISARGDYQTWPFGLGVVTTGLFSDVNGLGAIAICAVPDGFTRDEGGTAKIAWAASMERHGPKLLFTFTEPADARALASELLALAIAMEARRGATGNTDATAEGGDSAGPKDIAQEPSNTSPPTNNGDVT